MMFVSFFILLSNSSFGQDDDDVNRTFIDLGTCGFRIEEVSVVGKIKTERKTIKAHDRGYTLAVIKLHGKAPTEGLIVFNPTIFSLIGMKEGEPFVVSSRGIGKKYTTTSGEEKEFWVFHKKNAIVTSRLELKMDEDVEFYVVFDLPKKVEHFTIQIPSILEQGRIKVPIE
jgi:hypothetical protein